MKRRLCLFQPAPQLSSLHEKILQDIDIDVNVDRGDRKVDVVVASFRITYSRCVSSQSVVVPYETEIWKVDGCGGSHLKFVGSSMCQYAQSGRSRVESNMGNAAETW